MLTLLKRISKVIKSIEFYKSKKVGNSRTIDTALKYIKIPLIELYSEKDINFIKKI